MGCYVSECLQPEHDLDGEVIKFRSVKCCVTISCHLQPEHDLDGEVINGSLNWRLAHSVEQHPDKVQVIGSNPVSPTEKETHHIKRCVRLN